MSQVKTKAIDVNSLPVPNDEIVGRIGEAVGECRGYAQAAKREAERVLFRPRMNLIASDVLRVRHDYVLNTQAYLQEIEPHRQKLEAEIKTNEAIQSHIKTLVDACEASAKEVAELRVMFLKELGVSTPDLNAVIQGAKSEVSKIEATAGSDEVEHAAEVARAKAIAQRVERLIAPIVRAIAEVDGEQALSREAMNSCNASLGLAILATRTAKAELQEFDESRFGRGLRRFQRRREDFESFKRYAGSFPNMVHSNEYGPEN